MSFNKVSEEPLIHPVCRSVKGDDHHIYVNREGAELLRRSLVELLALPDGALTEPVPVTENQTTVMLDLSPSCQADFDCGGES